ncbi:2TM domain-containing protein [Microbacteriaceae bacterium MWH-Ta3]|nr:2TM domain-containing protein [Microbacteriaceae bacterium MWH-Ta3]
MTDTTDEVLRAAALKSLKKKRDFVQFLWVWLAVSLITNAIYFIATPGSGYWPIWQMLGMGIAAFFVWMDAYGRAFNKPITDDDIAAEMRKLSGS